jgi:hypothetical protein
MGVAQARRDDGAVSFEIFLQGFSGGQMATGHPDEALRVLAPYIVEPPIHGYVELQTMDGGADVYGVGGDSLMVNHASGEHIWDLLVAAAAAADWVVMPVGCPTCVTSEEQVNHLPEELRHAIAVVSSGEGLLLDLIRQS